MEKEIFLTAQDLSDRWKVPLSTLQAWRFNATGPLYTQLNGIIRYTLEEVQKFERSRLRRHTADNVLVRGVEGKVKTM